MVCAQLETGFLISSACRYPLWIAQGYLLGCHLWLHEAGGERDGGVSCSEHCCQKAGVGLFSVS